MKKIKNTLIILLFFSTALLTTGCFPKSNTYGVDGIPVVSGDKKSIVAVVAESEGLSHQENGGFVKTIYNTSYWLKKYDIATGELLKKKELIASAEKTNSTASCYGVYDNKVWVYVNGIVAYDINSFEEVVNEEKMAAVNGVKRIIFPYGERLVNPSVENGYIDFTADNGEAFRLILKDLKIISKKDAVQTGGIPERNISRLLKKDNDYGIRCDTFNNKMFALAKDNTKAGSYYLGDYSVDEVAYRMKFFKADYTMKRLGDHNSFDFINITQQGSDTYLNANFAKNFYSGRPIHLSQPAGYLIIHQDTLGSNSKSVVTRVDTSNKKIWETATGVSTKIAGCVLSGRYCIISTNTDYMLSPHVGKDALCIIDTETGALIKPAINK